MKQNSAMSWSFMLMATCLFGVGLGLSLGFLIFSPKATPALNGAPTPPLQAAAPASASGAPPAASVDPAPAPAQTAAASSTTPVRARQAAASTPEHPTPAVSGEAGYWAARHLFIAVNGQWLADGVREVLAELRPGGVMLQDVNLGSRTQTFALVKEIKTAVGMGEGLGDLPLIAAQQEVGPYNLLGLENAPSAQTLGENGDPELARKLGQEYGAACVGRGIAIAFAPVLDVFEPGAINPGFAVRSFGTEHTLVARIALAMADGLRQGGVLPVVKHFPGYGAATYGSDGLLVALNKDPAGLGKLLYPFDQAVRRGIPGILVAHVAVPALDPENPRRPAALSPVLVTELLRTRWRYDGVIVADDVALNSMTRSMGAEAAAIQALAAGCDAVILLDPDPARIRAVSAAITAAVARGTLSKEKLLQSVARLSRWQEAIGNLNPIRVAPEMERVAQGLPPATALPGSNAPAQVETAAPAPTLPEQSKPVPAQVEVIAAEAPPPAAETPAPEPAPPAIEAAAPGAAETPESSGPTAAEAELSRIEYTVREGDLLSNIARDYNVTLENLVRWNALESAQVPAGTRLTLYLGDGASAPAAANSAPGTAPAVTPQKASTQASEVVGFGAKTVHTVAEGETLPAIAEKFKVAAADLRLWNGLDTDEPAVGTVLTIFLGSTAAPETDTPPADATPAPTPTPAETPEEPTPPPAPVIATDVAAPPAAETETLTVQAGDTVSKIAREHKTTVDAILALNGLKDANQIFAGQRLKLPRAAP